MPILLLVALWVWIARRGSAGATRAAAFGRNPGHVYTTERPPTTFDDVAGYEAVKADIREVVEFLRDPAKFQEIGARIPKGVLLVGPPGTGKTLIARAVAGEAGVPFISVTGSHFMEMFVGVGAARVRGLFDTARKNAPSIIFVDEIDSIGRGARWAPSARTTTSAIRPSTSCWPRWTASTARSRSSSWPPPIGRTSSIQRCCEPGGSTVRWSSRCRPSTERIAILEVHCRDKKIGPDIDLEVIGRATPGMSGADLANLVNEAALGAVREGCDEVRDRHFEAARDRVLMGLQRTSMALSEHEKWAVARHEAGHAVMAYLLDHADPVHKVTILPSGHVARRDAAAPPQRAPPASTAATSWTPSRCTSAAGSRRS